MYWRWRTWIIAGYGLLVTVAGASAQNTGSANKRQIEEARRLLAGGSTQQAVALLRDLAAAQPDDAETHLLLGTALALVPVRSEAIRELNRAAELNPTPPVYHALGTALARFGEYDEALEALETAIRLDPNFAEARVNLALLLAGRGEFSRAEEHVSLALRNTEDGSRTAYLHYLRGKLLMELQKWDEAARELEQATALDPANADAYFQLGIARQASQAHEESARALAKAVELDPSNATAQYHLGLEYLQLDRPERAIEHLQAARRGLPDDRGVLLNLARSLRKAGREEEAADLTRELAKMARSQLTSAELQKVGDLNKEAVALEQSGNIKAALEKYDQALEIDPNDKVVRRNRALALCRLGRWEDAARELERVLEQNPDDTEARKLLYHALEQDAKTGQR